MLRLAFDRLTVIYTEEELMIWLVGANGMLGKDLAKQFEKQCIPFLATDMDVNITKMSAIEEFTHNKSIRWIINASAYTNVEGAESNQQQAYAVNELGVKNLASYAKKQQISFIHFSTDYVFDGSKGSYIESDKTNPISVYGASKLAGELAVAQTTEKYYIFRISWLFGLQGANFVKKMLELMQSRTELKVVDDQYGSPTYTQDVASVIVHLISHPTIPFGIYHLTNQGKTTWFEFAQKIYELAKEKGLPVLDLSIKAVQTSEFPTIAKRPANSYLIKDKLQHTFGIQIPTWQSALSRYFEEMK